MHGVSYACNVNIFIVERILWFVIFGLFFGLAVFWTVDAYNMWDQFPVITSVRTTGMLTHFLRSEKIVHTHWAFSFWFTFKKS